MILKTTTTNGRKRYFDAFSGREINIHRVAGRGTSRLPDIAAFYLTPGPRKQVAETVQPVTRETCRPFTRKQIEEKYNRLSWWSRMFHWIKKLF